MTLRFEHPEWLWAFALLPFMAFALLSWCSGMSLPRRWLAVFLRAGVWSLLLALLAGATAVRTTDKLAVIAVIDVSQSVRSYGPSGRTPGGAIAPPIEGVRAWLQAATLRRRPSDLLGLVLFDGSAALIAPPSALDVLDRPLELQPTEGTDIASALRLAVAAFPRDAARRILLISDGVATQGDARAAAREASGVRDAPAAPASNPEAPTPTASSNPSSLDRIAIDVLPLSYDVAHEIMVESVDAPTRAPAGAAVAVRVTLSSSGPASGVLRLFHEGEELPIGAEAGALGRRIELHEGRQIVVLNVPLGPARVHRFRAVFEPDAPSVGSSPVDTIADNNVGEAVTVSPGKGAVLLVDGVSRGDPTGPGAILARVLREEGVDVDVVGPDAFPADLLRLQAYDLILLQNVPADALGEPAMERLVRFVVDLGGGLCMIGGPDSFASGGYKGSPLEPILPVKLDLPDKLVVPAAAVIIVLDRSGSMGWRVGGSSRTQQDIANEGAAMAIRTLDKNDLVGVISFDNRYTVDVPLAKNADSAATSKKILAIQPDGGTNIPPALEEAYRQIHAADAKVKHVIVLTDGVSQGKNKLNGLAARMAADGIKVSAIAVGDDADAGSLAEMAQAGGGQFYRVADPNTLPRVFLRAVRVVRTPLYREEPFVPVVADPASPLLDGFLSAGEIPPLGGLALAQVRPEITALYPLVTAEGEPVLAHWQAGLGQVAAFTSDAHNWAEQWISWPGYRALWTRVVRQISRAAGSRQAELSAEAVGDQLRIRVDAAGDDGRLLDGLTIPASVYAPDGRRLDARLAQIGPGAYEAMVRVDQPGSYVITATPRNQGKALTPVVGGVTRPPGAELRVRRSDEKALGELAAITGGRTLDLAHPESAALFDRAGLRPREARTPLWPYLLPWALGLVLADFAVRRIAWDRLVSSRFGQGLKRVAALAVRDRSRQAAATIGALIERDQEVQARHAAPDATRLTAADARRIVEERTQQLQAAQRARVRGVRPPSPAPPSPAATPAPARSDAPEQAPPPEGGLLAAKRRARERFEQDKP